MLSKATLERIKRKLNRTPKTFKMPIDIEGIEIGEGDLYSCIQILRQSEEGDPNEFVSILCKEENRRFILTYLLRNINRKNLYGFRVFSEKNENLKIKSIGKLFPSSIFYEKEISAFFGINIENSEIVKSNDLIGIEGHPLTKEYQFPSDILGITRIKKDQSNREKNYDR